MPNHPSFRLLNKLLNSLHEVVCVFDTNFQFVYVNQACYSLWGYQPEELIGRSCFDFMLPEERQTAIQTTMQAFEGEYIPTYENHYQKKDGTIVTMFWQGGWDHDDQLLYCTGRDITEQRRLEQTEAEYNKKLQSTKAQLEDLLNRITDGFIGLDKDARITYWNRAAEEITGRSNAEVINHIIWDLIEQPSKNKYLEIYSEIIKDNKRKSIEVYSDRLQMWIEINTYISGTGLSVFLRDITETRKLKERLLHEQQMQQKHITAAIIRTTEKERAEVGKELHDNVNQVLTTVKLYMELCLSKDGDNEQLLQKSIKLLQESINEIRGLSKRLSAPSLGKIHLKDSVAELIEAFNAANKMHITLKQHINTLEVPEEVHIGIYRILQEHLTNVLKHSKAKSAKVNLDVIDNNLILDIKDNGIGFDRQINRSGIGIANMESRTEDLNGSFNIYSEPGKGCELKVSIPI